MVLLSIGMIVKNEEASLRTCCEALSSLRKNVPCELIISDTGSTDKTREIAAEYADILVDFEWCNDFAAARNSTVDRATGKWYMFIDADEEFESTKEIEAFFNTGEYKKYHSASYVIHSYLDPQRTAYIDNMGPRMFDLSMPEARFIHSIHEAIPCHQPTKLFTDFVHHTGYIRDGEKEIYKHERNMELLLHQLEENPDDIRTLAHLAREYTPGGEEAQTVIKYCNQGLRAIQKEYQRKLSQNQIPKTLHLAELTGEFFSLYHQKLLSLYNLSEWEKVEQGCKQYFKATGGKTYRNDIDILLFYGKSCFRRGKFEDAIAHYDRYIELRDAYVQGKLETTDALFGYLQFTEETDKISVLMEIISCCVKCDKYEEAFSYLKQLPLEKVEHLQPAFLAMEGCNKFDYALDLWKRYTELDDPTKLENFLYEIENYERTHPKQQETLIRTLAKYQGEDTYSYVLLNRMRVAYLDKATETVEEYARQIVQMESLPRLLADSIYYVMYCNLDLTNLFNAVVIDDLKIYIADIKVGHKDFAEAIKKYFIENRYINSDYGMYWELMFEEAALLTNDLYDEDALELLPNYLEAVTKYTNLIYDKQMLNEDRLGVLPNYARFAYYVGQALDADNIGDELGYYRNMTKAVDQYKVMAKPIKLLTDHHQKEIEERQSKAKQDNQELMELAAQVKKQLYAFIEQENYLTAKEVLAGYEKIFPTDPDLTSIREMIGAGEAGNRSAIPS